MNAQYNLKQAAAFFDARFGHNGWAVPLVVARVHADAPGEGHFDGGTGVITLGDGIRPGPNDPYKTYSPATSLDYVTHEYAHGVIAQLTRAPTRYAYGLGTSGEPGAINEGLADIFAATADMNATKSLSNAFKTAARRSVRDGDVLPYERWGTELPRHRRREGQPRVLPL